MRVKRIASRREKGLLRVAAYCRVSTLKDSQEESYETQVGYYTDLISAHDDWTLVDIFADHGFTGTSAKKRPAFNRLIRLARQGEIDLILVKSISRFSRNIVDCQKYVTELKERNVEIRFEKESISSFDPSTDFVFSLLSIVAQDESRSISDNVKWGYQRRYANGEYCLGNNHTFGYDTDKTTRKLIPNKDAWAVRLVFQRFVEGATYKSIIDELMEKGVARMRSKSPWTASNIRSILRNETYVGDKLLQKNAPCDFLTKRPDPTIEYDSFYLENDHEAIVDRETWNRAQELLDARERERALGVMRRGKEHHVFYGRVFCGECGQAYKRRTFSVKEAGGTRHYHAWNCRERQKGKNGNGCRNVTLQETVLEEMIASALGWSAFSDERFVTEVERVEVTPDGIQVLRKAA